MNPSTPKARRIIHVANFGFRPVKTYLHGTGAKLSNGWTRAGHHVINFSDRDIARWTGFLGLRELGARTTNRLLLDLCKNNKPDVVAFGHADLILPETIAQIRTALPAVKMLQWNIDWIVPQDHALSNDPTAGNNKEKIRAKQAVLDATFVTTAGPALKNITSPGHIVSFLPNPVDTSIERGRNFEIESLPHDLFFASNSEDDRRFHCGQWRGMGDFCRDLQNAIPDLRFGLYGINGAPKVFGPAYEEAILKCRMGLNISRRNDAYLYSSDRIAHLIGNGLAVCIDRASGYADIFSDDEMIFYSSETELFEKISRFKNDDAACRKLAERGWKRYNELFNSTVVGQYMLDVTFKEQTPQPPSWPNTTLQGA